MGVYAGQLVRDGAIGKVLQILCLAPHRLNAPSRPDWFFEREKYGGILCDIGSHQIEQILYYAGAKDAQVLSSRVANFNSPQYPELEQTFADEDLRLLAINVQSRKEKSLRYLKENPVDLEILYDTGDQVSRAFGIVALPTIVLVDADGQIMQRWEGTRGLREAGKALALYFEAAS